MTILHLRRGRILLHLRAQRLGEDLSLTLSGGDREHIGAVAVAVPYADGKATASVLALPGHREDLLARRLALHLAGSLGITVSAACGVHIDTPTPQELEDVGTIADELAAMLLRQLSSPAVSTGDTSPS